MQNFTFYNPAKIIFGKGTQAQAAQELSAYGKRVLLIYGGGSIKRTGLYDEITASLTQAGLFYMDLPGVQPNPRLSLVREGVKLCKENGLEAILAIGGGSVIDTAKAVAIGAKYDGDVWDFYEGKAKATQSLPMGVVLTIPAAGSESSQGSVITNEDGLLKRSYSAPCMISKFSILNPELTYTLPAYQTACGASDILAHMMERYFTQTPHVDFTDRLLEAAMRAIIDYAPLAISHPDDYDIRAEVMWAGTMAHNKILDPGRLCDWGSHQIEHEISAIYDIAHGAGLSIVFPAWMKYVCHENMDRFVQFAVRVFGVEFAMGDKERIVEAGIEKLVEFYHRIGMPTTFAEASLPGDRIREMAQKCCKDAPQGHFKTLYEEDVYEILKLAQ